MGLALCTPSTLYVLHDTDTTSDCYDRFVECQFAAVALFSHKRTSKYLQTELPILGHAAGSKATTSHLCCYFCCLPVLLPPPRRPCANMLTE